MYSMLEPSIWNSISNYNSFIYLASDQYADMLMKAFPVLDWTSLEWWTLLFLSLPELLARVIRV